MRIAIFTESYIPEVNGVIYHIVALRRGLIEAGHEVLIVKPDYKATKMVIEDGVLRSPAKKMKKMYDYSFAYPWSRKRFKMLKEWGPDVIHIHTEFSSGMFGLFAAKKLGLPIVYTCHTMYYDYLHYFGILENSWIVKKFIEYGLKKFTDSAQSIICASTKMENFLKSCDIKTPIYKIPNTCVASDFAISTLDEKTFSQLKETYNVKEDDMNLCFCGRIAEEKNLSVAIDYIREGLKHIPNIRFFIIGDGPDKTKLQEKVKSLDMGNTIIFTGKVDHSMIKYYYHLCDAYFMTSLSENHSISALEAIACGLPVIHLFDESNENQYEEGLTGFVFNNGDELIQVFKKVYEQNRPQDSSQKLKDKVVESAEKNDYKASTEKTIKIYEKIIENFNKV